MEKRTSTSSYGLKRLEFSGHMFEGRSRSEASKLQMVNNPLLPATYCGIVLFFWEFNENARFVFNVGRFDPGAPRATCTHLHYQNCGSAWKVGDGNNIIAGRDNWVHGKVPVFASHIRLTGAKLWRVSHFIRASELRWNAALIRDSFDNNDANSILSVELPSSSVSVPDRLYWPKNKVGNFTVKTGYAFLQEQLTDQDASFGFRQNRFVPFFKLLWDLKILPKWKLFIWKIMVEGLPMKASLERRGISLDISCDLCSDFSEDAQHMFRHCKLAQDVWRSSMLGIYSNFNENHSLQQWILNYIQLFISEDGKYSDQVVTFIGILWALRVTRNSRVFRSETGDIQEVQTQVTLALKENAIYMHKDSENWGVPHTT
ncbi:uncharacterized protein [Spinacia oleracea]|uniref:Reverse transcriptase zinc-binding domain-containing protein n=1 Tax=Spinacia oleracea TaxID=3562 RepID=A0ABM3RP73_SPIOL|nr:uncharacterized protein LOC130471376 [Spinacia oleracea]